MFKKVFRNTLMPWFAIGVILPGLFLMFFGLRAIRNERYTIEHRIQEQYYSSAAVVSDKIERLLASLSNYADTVSSHFTQNGIANSVIEDYYYLPGRGRVQHHSRYIRRGEMRLEDYFSSESSIDSFTAVIGGMEIDESMEAARTYSVSGGRYVNSAPNSRAVSAYMLLYDRAKRSGNLSNVITVLNAFYNTVVSDTSAVIFEEAVFYSAFILRELAKLTDSSGNLQIMQRRRDDRIRKAQDIYRLEEFSSGGRMPDSGYVYLDTAIYYVRKAKIAGFMIFKISSARLLDETISVLGGSTGAELRLFGPDGLPYGSHHPANYEMNERGSVGIRTRLSPSLPMITMQLSESEPDEIRAVLRRYRLFYGIFFLLLVVAIGVGSFSLVLAARRETEIARMRSNFIAGVSHELKTPLTSIHMLAEMLQSGKVKDETKKTEYYAVINRETERLSSLINRVLDFSRINEGRTGMEYAPVDVDTFIDEALMSLSAMLDEKDAEIDRERSRESLVIHGDKKMLVQVALNLIENAVKYSDGKPHIEIRTVADREYRGFSVRDHGIGIKEGEEKLIFGEFFRGTSQQVKTVAGTGLGLAIVQRIVRQHNGRVSARNAPDGGLLVSVLFPVPK